MRSIIKMDTEIVNRVFANGEHFWIKITFIFEWDNDGAARETGSPIIIPSFTTNQLILSANLKCCILFPALNSII